MHQSLEGDLKKMSNPLLIKKIFPTIQGEGPYAGRPAVFVRLGSCNLECPLCDTEFREGAVLMEEEAILSAIGSKDGISLAVITGGEPFQHKIGPLTRELIKRGFQVQIETNGTLYQEDFPYGDPGAVVVCSPKMPKVHPRLAPYVAAYKYVVRAGYLSSDGLPSESFGGVKAPPARPAESFFNSFRHRIYLSPCDEKNPAANAKNLEAAVDSCLAHDYLLSVQIHKIIGME